MEGVQQHYDKITSLHEDESILVLLVGTKVDLEDKRQVSVIEAEEFVQKINEKSLPHFFD